MEKEKRRTMKIIRVSLTLMMLGSFLFFVLGQLYLPVENQLENTTFTVYEMDWVQVVDDGSKRSIKVPGSCEADHGEWVTIETQLPSSQKDTSICVRSMQQELKIYVGDQL